MRAIKSYFNKIKKIKKTFELNLIKAYVSFELIKKC
jgi:hypothetical protein